MRALAYPLAVLIVAALSFGAVAFAAGASTWVRWVLRVGGLGGLVGLALTGASAVNLFVPRTCAEAQSALGSLSEVNRPAFSVVVDDGPCFESGLAQVQLVVLAALVTTAATLVTSGVALPARR